MGGFAIFAASFSPIPYKVFTITAGVLGMPFLLASLIGGGLRFFLVAMPIDWGDESMEAKLRRWIDWLSWLTVLAVVIIVLVYQF